LDLLVFSSPGTSTPLSPLDLIYLLFSHTPNLWNLCQFQGLGTNPTGRTKIYVSLFAPYFCFCLRLGIDVRIATSICKRLHWLRRQAAVTVFTEVTTKFVIFWDVEPCKSCDNWRFGRTCRLHLQGTRDQGNALTVD
jgi:hypothetical protein